MTQKDFQSQLVLPDITKLRVLFVRKNIELITTLSQKQRDQVELLVMQALREGSTSKELEKILQVLSSLDV